MLAYEGDCSRSCLEYTAVGGDPAQRLSFFFPDGRARLGLDIKQSKNPRDSAEKICQVDMVLKLEMLVCCKKMRGVLKFNLKIEIFHVSPSYSDGNNQ